MGCDMMRQEKAREIIDGLGELIRYAKEQYEIGNPGILLAHEDRHILEDALTMIVTQDEIISCVQGIACIRSNTIDKT